MNRPRLYESDGVLMEFINKSPKELAKYIKTLNNYIYWLENKYGIDDELEEQSNEENLD